MAQWTWCKTAQGQTYFYDAAAGVTQWARPLLYQMQPETKPTFSSEGGVYELCSDGDSSVFSYHSSDMSVRQWSARDMQQQRTIGTMSASEPEGENPVPVGLCVISKSSSSGDSDSSTSCSSRQLYLCAVARYSILSNTASHVVVLDVPREAGDHHVAGSKFALKFNPGKEPRVCAGLQHELYLAGLKGTVTVWDPLAVHESTSAASLTTLQPVRELDNGKEKMGIVTLSAFDNYLVAGDILGAFRVWIDGVQHCFPLLGNQCGDRYRTDDGQITAVALHAPKNRFYAARGRKIYMWRWSDVRMSLKYMLARANPTPLAVFALEEDQTALVCSLACSDSGRVFSGQDDGTIAVWPLSSDPSDAANNDDDEYEYEYDLTEQAPDERFAAFGSGVVRVYNIHHAIWSCSSTADVIRIWSGC